MNLLNFKKEDKGPNYVTWLSRSEHSLRVLLFDVSRLTNVLHSLYKEYSQSAIITL